MHISEFTIVQAGCLIVAIILHEVSHGVVALWFGDDTAKRAGRLTLNPIPHIDPLGSLIIPAFGILAGIPVIGWAKPVPINPSRMRNPRRDHLFVGLAGPVTNFLLMAIAAVAARYVFHNLTFPVGATIEDLPLGFQLLFAFALVNLFLGVFNLLPIPPLDGSTLVERVLPREWLPAWWRFRQYGILVLFILVFWTNLFTTVMKPFENDLVRFILG